MAGTSITDIAKHANFSPYLLARRVVEEMTDLGKKGLGNVMKDPLGELRNIDLIKEKYRKPEEEQKSGR